MCHMCMVSLLYMEKSREEVIASQTRGAFALFCLFLHYYVHHTLISQFLHATIVGREVRYDTVDILAGAQIQSPIPVVHGLSIASASSMSAAT
jgi:hypothetical protein